MTTLFWIAVGAFIGWNIPQPRWAEKAQKSAVKWIKTKIG